MSTSRRDFLKTMAVFSGAVLLGSPKDALAQMERNVPVVPLRPEGLTSEKLEEARRILNEQPVKGAYEAVVHPKTMRQLAFEDTAWSHLKTKPGLHDLFVEHLQDRVRPDLERAGFQMPTVYLGFPSGAGTVDTLDSNIRIALRAYKSQFPVIPDGKRPPDLQVYQNAVVFSSLYRASRETVEHMAWSVEEMAQELIVKYGDPVA